MLASTAQSGGGFRYRNTLYYSEYNEVAGEALAGRPISNATRCTTSIYPQEQAPERQAVTCMPVILCLQPSIPATHPVRYEVISKTFARRLQKVDEDAMTGSEENNNTEDNVETTEAVEATGEATTETTEAAPTATKREPTTLEQALVALKNETSRSDIPTFAIGDTVKVHARIVEGNKERIQIFEGVVIKRRKGEHSDATFTVRKVSYNVGVERTFPLHSPRVEKVEVVSSAKVRRARLFYLRPLRGKAARLKTIFQNSSKKATSNQAA